MTAKPPGDPGTVAAPRRSMNFRKYSKIPLPTPDEARRQSHVVQSAWRHFCEPGPVIAFLNSRHESLGGQPLHLAIESDAGLARVQALLSQMARETPAKAQPCE
jgi:hypothetical protein